MDNKASGTTKNFLKPSVLAFGSSLSKGDQNENGSSENGNTTTVVNNPFLKCDKEELDISKEKQESNNDRELKDSAKDTTTASTNLFKPAATNLLKNACASSLSENSNFVFGQNLLERVVIENKNSKNSGDDEKIEDTKCTDNTLLFTRALTSTTVTENDSKISDEQQTPSKQATSEDKSKNDDSVIISTQGDSSLSLVEAARKWEEMRGAQKRKYDEVEVTTGEEGERNILDMSCKLFTFIENNWEERGRGTLRLNDSKSHSSRVVFRASGSLRVLLNTKVWKDQICEQPSQKSLRITAIDPNGVIKIYLVMGRNDDVSALFRALSSRIEKEKKRIPELLDDEPESLDEKSSDDSDEPAVKKPTTAVE